MSERYIELTDRKWKTPDADRAIKWSTSAKGNFYTTFRGFVIVVLENRYKKGVWQYMTTPDLGRDAKREEAVWDVHGKFDNADDAKAAAINALRPKREPVPVPATESIAITTIGGRKIVV